ncbi:MAG: class I SAM-dependent methyltransferase [Acidimicrobiales bacterium]
MSGQGSDWEWDETLFAGAAPFYERGRLPYAPGLADALAAAIDLDKRGRLLDLGCGPGTVALQVAHLFEEVVGVDPDREMLAEAERLACERLVSNVRWVQRRAEELPASLGPFRVVTFAASLHWMDRALVAAKVRAMLEPDGVVVHVDSRHHDSLRPTSAMPEIPRDRIDELRRRYLGEDRRAGASIRNTSPSDEAEVFRAAGFSGPEVVIVPDRRLVKRTIDDVVAEVFSMSWTAPHLFGDQVDRFEADLRDVLMAAAPGGEFGVRLPDNELNIWRVRAP